MSLKRWAAKRDDNEAAIVEALEAVGAKIFKLSGAGVPDLLVGFRGKWLPMEIKSEHGTLTKRQRISYAGGTGYPVVRTIQEALEELGVTTRGAMP